MAPVTEFVVLPIKPDAAAETVTSVVETNVATLLAQPGCHRARYSRTHEDAAKLRLFADWESLDAHRAFASNAAVYAPFQQRMGPIIDATAFGPSNPRRPPIHVEFAAPPPAVLDSDKGRSPVSEVLYLFFPSDVADDVRARIQATTAEFLVKLAPTAIGLTGESALGWSVEKDVVFKGEASRVFVAIIGWTSVEAHHQTRDTEGFKENISMIRTLESLKGMEVCHVSNVTIEGSK